MATQTARQYTEQDIAALTQAETALRDAGMDIDNPKCIELISGYLQANPKIPVTYENVIQFVHANNTQFIWLSAAHRELNKIVGEDPAAAQKFATWFNVQTQLVKTGDEGFENSSLLLTELRGRDAGDRDRIQEAIGRISYRGGRQLHFAQSTRTTVNPRSHAPADDGQPFLGRGVNKSPLDYRREMNEAAEKNNPTAPAPTSSVQAAAKAEAESLKGNTHSETEQLGRVFVTLPGTSEIDWVQTLASREAFQRRLNNQQAVRRFIR
jgi:hypothetical protein